MSVQVDSIDHVNLPIPVGSERVAEEFWVGMLGFSVRPKPPTMAARGGRWFVQDNFEVHVSPVEDFKPHHLGHVALRVHGLDALKQSMELKGVVFVPNFGPGDVRASYFVSDPFGNRVELIAL